MRRERLLRNALSVVLVTMLTGSAALSAEVTSLDFVQEDGYSVLKISGSEALQYELDETADSNQIVLNLPGASLSGQAKRPLDTSSFQSPVMLVSPYELDTGGSRIVMQLREGVDPVVSQQGSVVEVRLPTGSASAAGAVAATDEPFPAADDEGLPETAGTPPGPDLGSNERIDQFIEGRETQNFTGSPITLKVRDMDVRDVLRLISETSGFNIVVEGSVQGNLTLSLEQVPWDQVLDVVLRIKRLGAERTHNVLRVMSLADLAHEKQEELAAKQALRANAPRITRVFPLSYQDPDRAAELIANLLGGAAGEGEGGARTGSVRVDDHTRSLLVRDTVENVERVRKLLEVLDTQIPQILVEGKIVEANEEFRKVMNGNIGLASADDSSTQFIAAFNDANATDQLLGGVVGDGGLGGGGGFFGFSPSLGFLPGVERLNAVLQMSETESLAKVIASPRLVVVNNQEATFKQEVVFVSQTPPPEGTAGVANPAVTTSTADLSLVVKPQATNDGNILMDLVLTRPVVRTLGAVSGSEDRQVDTQVIVRDGSTLVLGGVYTMDTRYTESGFPILRDIPILGALFGGEATQTTRTELFMFITPRILNPKEAGLVSNL